MATHRITTNDLLQGSCYAVEQAGNLLQDAITLYRAQRCASAAALAVLCQEEIGRAHLYLARRKFLLPSGTMSAKELTKLCEDHKRKLNWGEVTTEFPGKNISLKGMEELAQQKRKAAPHRLHGMRLRSLYVEYVQEKGQWNRPSENPKPDCTKLLTQVANHYAAFIKVILREDSEVCMSIQQWAERPHFPEPAWPR